MTFSHFALHESAAKWSRVRAGYETWAYESFVTFRFTEKTITREIHEISSSNIYAKWIHIFVK